LAWRCALRHQLCRARVPSGSSQRVTPRFAPCESFPHRLNISHKPVLLMKVGTKSTMSILASSGCGISGNRCHLHKKHCCNLSPLQKWLDFCADVKGKTPKEALRLVPRFRSCSSRTSLADKMIHQQALCCIKFAREKKRLLRQMTTTPNYLSCLLPFEPDSKPKCRGGIPFPLLTPWTTTIFHTAPGNSGRRACVMALATGSITSKGRRQER